MNSPIQYLAEIKRRALATFIDYLFFSVFHVWFLLEFGDTELIDGRQAFNIEGPLGFIPLIVWFITFPVMESVEGKTVGKLIMKLKVVRLDGQPLTLLDAIKRRVLDWIDFALLGLPSLIASTNSRFRQRLGDMWAKTSVIDLSVIEKIDEGNV